jgi:lactoylglutathione lyase
MLKQIDIVTLIVSDQRQSLAFFRDYLGFEVRDDREFLPGIRWITVAPKGAATAISLWPAGAEGAEDKGPGGDMPSISFLCDDARATHAEFAAKGIPVLPLDQAGWGLQFGFSDPDGNWFNVVEPQRHRG